MKTYRAHIPCKNKQGQLSPTYFEISITANSLDEAREQITSNDVVAMGEPHQASLIYDSIIDFDSLSLEEVVLYDRKNCQ